MTIESRFVLGVKRVGNKAQNKFFIKGEGIAGVGHGLRKWLMRGDETLVPIRDQTFFPQVLDDVVPREAVRRIAPAITEFTKGAPVHKAQRQPISSKEIGFLGRATQKNIVIEVDIVLGQAGQAVQKRFDNMGIKGGQVFVRDKIPMIHKADFRVSLFEPGRALPVRNQMDGAQPRGIGFKREQGIAQFPVVAVTPGFYLFAGIKRIMSLLDFFPVLGVGAIHPSDDRIHRKARFGESLKTYGNIWNTASALPAAPCVRMNQRQRQVKPRLYQAGCFEPQSVGRKKGGTPV